MPGGRIRCRSETGQPQLRVAGDDQPGPPVRCAGGHPWPGGLPGLATRLVELGRLGTKWESPALMWAFHGSLLLTYAWPQLR
jgi:hypothetical protein